MKEDKKIKHYIQNNEIDLEKIINDYTSYIGTIINNMSTCNLSEEDKEEIASEVIFVLWKNQYKLDYNKNLSSYIAGITRNITREYLRKISNNFNIEDYENKLYSKEQFDIDNDNIEKINIIEKKINKMKNLDRRIFVDFYYLSKSIKDIAKEQTISEFNVKQRLYRIRNKIRKEG